ncbi:MAG TPA: ATP-binding protein [Opitutaceae bacterium]|nr:ATP-binding protein [Opitutaceae bacterium]
MLPPTINSRLSGAWLLVFVLGIASGGVAFKHARENKLADLRAAAGRAAATFEPSAVAALEGKPTDVALPRFAEVQKSLRQIAAAQSGVHSAHLLRIDATGSIERIASADAFSPQAFEVAPDVPAPLDSLRALHRSPTPPIVGVDFPVTGRGVSWAVSYASIGGPHRAAKGDVSDVLAVFSEANVLRAPSFDAAAHAAVYAWLLFGIPLALLSLRRKQSSHEAIVQKLAEAVEQSQSGIMIVRPDGRIEFANAGLCRQLQYDAPELIGRSCRELQDTPSPKTFFDRMLEGTRDGLSWEGDWIARKKNGTTYSVRSVITPVYNARREHLGFIAVVTDMTAQQREQAKLLEAKNAAETADRAKGHFLATMSHEVRTPVHGIVGFTTLLLETQLTSEQRDYVQTIRTSANALVQLTGDILDFSRGESGTLQLESMACDLRATIEDALDMFAGTAAEKQLELLHLVERDVPSQVILDGGRVRQVLVNLINNAIKFTPGGEVEVRLRVLSGKSTSIAPFDLLQGAGQMVAEFDDGSLTFEFSVRDTGIGIVPEDRPKLFQPFSQLDTSSVRRFGGAGLGLAISRNLVRLMSGDIWLTSERGKGTTFTFTVRGRPAPESDVTVSPFADLSGLKVSLVQLSPNLTNELTEVLQSSGVQVVSHSMFEINANATDMVIVECAAIDAEAAAKALRANWRTERMIGLVNVNLGAAARQALRPHFGSLLNKPVHHRALLDLLLRVKR